MAELPSKAYNPLFIYGGVGLGKTHLLHAVGHQIARLYPSLRLLYLSTERFTNELINAIRYDRTAEFRAKYRTIDLLLIDDIQFISGKERTQEEFFHTFNDLYEARKQIVVSSDSAPKEIPEIEERLRSRFEWGLIADIQPPDFETRVAILKKKAEIERVRLPDDVAYLIASRIKANIREIEGSLTRMIAFCSLSGREMSVDLAQEVLADLWGEEEKIITIEQIQRKAADFFGIKLSDMRAKNRTKAIAFPRQIAMYLARQLTHASLAEIGRAFGGKDHTTVLHAVEKIQNAPQGRSQIQEDHRQHLPRASPCDPPRLSTLSPALSTDPTASLTPRPPRPFRRSTAIHTLRLRLRRRVLLFLLQSTTGDTYGSPCGSRRVPPRPPDGAQHRRAAPDAADPRQRAARGRGRYPADDRDRPRGRRARRGAGQGGQPGAITISARKLLEIVKELPSAPLALEGAGERLGRASGAGARRTGWSASRPEDFPARRAGSRGDRVADRSTARSCATCWRRRALPSRTTRAAMP